MHQRISKATFQDPGQYLDIALALMAGQYKIYCPVIPFDLPMHMQWYIIYLSMHRNGLTKDEQKKRNSYIRWVQDFCNNRKYSLCEAKVLLYSYVGMYTYVCSLHTIWSVITLSDSFCSDLIVCKISDQWSWPYIISLMTYLSHDTYIVGISFI